MARSRLSLKRVLLYSTFAAVALLSASAMAQDSTTTTDQSATTTATGTTSATSEAADSSSSADDSSDTTTTATGSSTAVATSTGSESESGSTTSLPTLSDSSSASATSGTTATDMPTLSTTATSVSSVSYPAPSVPPTENAPFMKHSKAPTGTVFIAVGAILGAIFLAVLLWRGIVAWLLHRSVARAALAQHLANDKATFAAPSTQYYKYTDRDSTHNLAGTTATNSSGRGVRRTRREPVPSATPSQTNLFFSPTAAAGTGGGMPGDRASRLLPSGFYAAGNSNIGGNAVSSGTSINLSTFQPDSRGPSRATGSSPPDSPAFGPRTSTPNLRNASGSSIGFRDRPQSGQSQRPPSAYLDDLLDDQQESVSDHHNGHYNNSNNRSSRGRY